MPQRNENRDLFAGAGEMGRLMRERDWSATPLGPVERWPQSLQIAVRIMLGSRYAMWLGWGQELTFLYNDAYARMTLGAKHPWALGRPAREVWAEIWQDIGPRAESVVRTGQATWDERLLLFLERSGFPEETYHTFSYSPLPNDQGGIGGMLCVVTEDTEQVIGERRLKTLRELAARTNEEAKSAEEACRTAAHTLAANPYDVPFSLFYLIDADDRAARLAGSTGLPPDSPAAPPRVDLTPEADKSAAWPLRTVMASGRIEIVTDMRPALGPLPIGVWPEPPHSAAVLPVRKSGQEHLAGFLVAGVSPRRPFDDAYQGFLELLAGQVATAVANARAYEEERRRAEALAELDRAKTAFFSNVSHEFRTPLTLMLGPVEDILAKPADGVIAENRELLEVVHRNGLRLQKLVNTLLDFSRIEAGRVQASYEPTDLASFTADLASNFRSACQRAGLELVVDCPPLPEPVYVDREMWEKIVLNLLSNAFKFTFEGRIEVSLRQAGTVVELAVRDTGTGIPADQMPHLFERFHQVEGVRGRTQEGSGIGLALVRELVRLHGGDVRAESRWGEGSTFRVTISLGTAHLPPERLRAPRTLASTGLGATVFVEEALRWLPEQTDKETGRQGDKETRTGDSVSLSPCLPVSLSSPRPRILLADDNADMRDYIRRLLAGRYEVTAVADGLDAWDALRRAPPDLLLSDVMMPGLDGFGLLHELRADPNTQALPVILLSARAGEEARVEGLQAGADDYLTKPFSAKELLARIGSTLEIARLRREALERERRLLAEAEEQRNWLRITLSSIGDAVIATDAQGRARLLNPVAEALTGWQQKDAQGRPLEEIFVITNEVTGQPVENPVVKVLREGRVVGLANHTILTDRNGTKRPIDDSAAPIQGGDGMPLGVVLIFRDVTERRHIEQEIGRLNRDLQRRVTEFQTLLDVIPIGIAVADDPDCRRIWSNPAMTRLLRLPDGINISLSAPVEERPPLRVFAAGRELLPHELPLQTAIAAEREVRGVKHDLLLHDGTWLNLLNYAVPLYDEAGRVRGGLYAGVDITELERVQQALREADRRKDEFLATLAHELRNPLAPLRNSLQILKLPRLDAATAERTREMMERQVHHLVRLVDDLLDVSRVMRNKITLHREQVELASIVARAVETAQPLIEAQKHELTVRLPDESLPLEGDPIRLAQVIGNLLTNAAKYTEPGGRIALTAQRQGNEAMLRVRDTGIGIAPDMLPKVFDLFVQADHSTTRAQGGLGIGLTLVKNLVEIHGGTVEVHSAGLGKGSEFLVRLPLSTRRQEKQSGQSKPVEPIAPSPGHRLLVVDDNEDAADSLALLLRLQGHEVRVAHDGPTALELVKGYRPEMVFLDLGMPGMDGYEVARRLRRQPGLEKVRLAALTGWGQPDDRRRTAEAGFDHHLVKPVEPKTLEGLLADLRCPPGERGALAP